MAREHARAAGRGPQRGVGESRRWARRRARKIDRARQRYAVESDPQSDLPIRWSGREFVVVLPGLSGDVARTVAERVRAALQAAAHEGIAVAGSVTKLEGDESFGDVVSRARARARLTRGGAHNRIVDMN